MSSASKPKSAGSSPHGSDARVGSTIAGRYRIDAFLGQGSRGSVYSAEHILLHKPVALKILHRDLTKVPEIERRFEREAAAAANIDHPNVASAIDYGKLDDGTAYLALELVRGESLRSELAKGPFEAERAVHVVRQIAAGLGAAHAQQIVHRDLKPENILLSSKDGATDVVKILDFGLAKVASGPTSRPITELGVVLGTSDYMAPEQALGKGADARSDLYALGVIAYEMLAGRRPFHDCDENALLERQLSGRPPALGTQMAGRVVSPAVEAMVMKLLSAPVAERYQSAAALLADLSALPAPMTAKPPDPTRFGSLANADTVDARALAQPPPTSAAKTPKAATEPLLRGAGTRLREHARSLRQRSVAAFDAAAKRVHAQQARLPAPLQRRMPRTASRLVLGALMLSAIASGVGVTFLVAGWRVDSPAAGPSAVAPAAAAPKPPDPRGLAQLELAERLLKERNWNAAAGAVGEALVHDSTLSTNERTAAVLAETARREASTTAAFRLLQGPMGAKGAEVLFDLAANVQAPQKIRLRAEEWLGSEQFRRAAAPELAIAGQLRAARRCEDKRALLAFARELGDRRTLDYLKILASRTGCGRRGNDDCYPCLRKDGALADATATIERRTARK